MRHNTANVFGIKGHYGGVIKAKIVFTKIVKQHVNVITKITQTGHGNGEIIKPKGQIFTQLTTNNLLLYTAVGG